MASRNDLSNYSGYSFESMVDLILAAEENVKALEDSLAEARELIVDLNDRIEHLTELAYM